MPYVDYSALLANFDYFKKEPFLIDCDELSTLDAKSVEGSKLAKAILEWIYLNPNHVTYYTRKAYLEGQYGDEPTYYTADYFRACIVSRVYPNVKIFVVTEDEPEQYTGWKYVTGDDIAKAYARSGNPLELAIGQYVIVDDGSGSTDVLRFDGTSYKKVKRRKFESEQFGTIQPNDLYQMCAFDSLANNDLTVLYGSSGSGKTLLPLAYVMQELEAQRITRCHFVFHYEKLKYARELGYVKGTLQEKLLQTGSIGNILSSKLGDPAEVERLIGRGLINIMPTNAIRGFEAGETEAIFCTEAQDLDAYTVRTIIQRAKKGCKIILEGDTDEQVDISRKSGLGQVIDVFKGTSGFGCVKLINDYRSPYGRLADKIR